jgi:TatA/E family protein of Tat protein translocase
MFGPIGFPELMLIFMVVLLLFGPKKLPEFAKFLGKAIREFKKTVNDAKSTIEDELGDVDIAEDLKEINRDLNDIKSSAQFKLDDDNLFPEPKKTAEPKKKTRSTKSTGPKKKK